MNSLLEKYKRLMAESLAAIRKETTGMFTKAQATSQLADVFGMVGYSNPRFCRTLPAVTPTTVRSLAVKMRKLAMRQARRVRINTRGYA